MKIEVGSNKKIVVHLEHLIGVDDLTWAVVWQLNVEKNNATLTRQLIWKWAVINIVEGRLYKSHAMSEAAILHMPNARRLVDEHYPEFAPDYSEHLRSQGNEAEAEEASYVQLQRIQSGGNKLLSRFRQVSFRRPRSAKKEA